MGRRAAEWVGNWVEGRNCWFRSMLRHWATSWARQLASTRIKNCVITASHCPRAMRLTVSQGYCQGSPSNKPMQMLPSETLHQSDSLFWAPRANLFFLDQILLQGSGIPKPLLCNPLAQAAVSDARSSLCGSALIAHGARSSPPPFLLTPNFVDAPGFC